MADKYRPRSFAGIVGQPTDQIEGLLDGKDTPNFLLYGPPGTGKTTTAYVISRELQGSESELLEFNASDERGIDTVRDRIIPIADQMTLTGQPRVIFLDEMESMTKEAQQALRQPMEQTKAVFVLACNDLDAVHDAVQSRCVVLEYGRVGDADVKARVHSLAESEGVDLGRNEISTIVGYANGDMRVALQHYEQFARGAYPDDGDDPATDSNTLEKSAHNFLNGE
jgi:replication factor C small subunit